MSWFSDFVADVKKKYSQINNNQFKEAVMATCALVAAADGIIQPEEKQKVAKLIQNSDALKCFNPVELRDCFMAYCNLAEDDFSRIDLFAKVRKLKGTENAETCLKAALVIANADGVFEDCEKVVVKELCVTLGLNSTDYGV